MVVAVGSKFIYLFILYEIFKVILMCCVCVCVCVCVCFNMLHEKNRIYDVGEL